MSPDERKLQALSQVATKLNRSSDDLNRIIETIEKQINATGVGVSAWVDAEVAPTSANRQDSTGHFIGTTVSSYELGYAKVGDSWRIALREVSDDFDVDGEFIRRSDERFPTALSSTKRDLRCEAAAHLDKLIDKIIETANEYVVNVEKASHLAGATEKSDTQTDQGATLDELSYDARREFVTGDFGLAWYLVFKLKEEYDHCLPNEVKELIDGYLFPWLDSALKELGADDDLGMHLMQEFSGEARRKDFPNLDELLIGNSGE